jgi:hypothetical protein
MRWLFEFISWPRAILGAMGAVLAAFLFFQFGPFARLSEWGRGTFLFDMQPAWSPDSAMANLERFGESGRQLYRNFLIADFAGALVSIVPATLLLAVSLRGLPETSAARKLVALPLTVALADWVENAGILQMLAAFPDRAPAAMSVARYAGMAKFALFPVMGVVTVMFLLRELRRLRTENRAA